MKKKYWYSLVIIVISLPLVLNYFVTREKLFDYNVAGDTKDWVSFWITYLSSIASLAMVVITWWTLKQSKLQNDALFKQNHEQLEEIKKEREEDLKEKKEMQRARLVFDIIVYQTAYYLRIINIGKENAFNVSIKVNDEFINNIEEKQREIFKSMQNPFFVPIDKPKYFFIGFCDDIKKRWAKKDICLTINGTYCIKYEINETIYLEQFINKLHFIVDDELTTAIKYIKKGVITQNDEYYTIQKSLDSIAKALNKFIANLPKSDDGKQDN